MGFGVIYYKLDLLLNQKYSKIRHLIWLATMWRVEAVDLSSLVDQIICIS
jgi:hypothetical protein